MFEHWRARTGTGGEGKTFISALNPQPLFLKCSEVLIETKDAQKQKEAYFNNAEATKTTLNKGHKGEKRNSRRTQKNQSAKKRFMVILSIDEPQKTLMRQMVFRMKTQKAE